MKGSVVPAFRWPSCSVAWVAVSPSWFKIAWCDSSGWHRREVDEEVVCVALRGLLALARMSGWLWHVDVEGDVAWLGAELKGSVE